MRELDGHLHGKKGGMQNEEEAEQVAGMVVEVVEVMGEVWCGGGGGQQRACMKKSGCSRVALMKFLPKCANCRMRSATSPLSAAMPTLMMVTLNPTKR